MWLVINVVDVDKLTSWINWKLLILKLNEKYIWQLTIDHAQDKIPRNMALNNSLWDLYPLN